MNDQADVLRKLVDRQPPPAAEAALRPALLTVAGGKGGVGTTTVAVNLAVALAQSGYRTVLVDVDLAGGDVAQVCRLQSIDCVADVLASRRTIHEVLERGPAGVQVVAGVWAMGEAADASPPAVDRLLAQLAALGPHADVVVLDVGSSLTRAARTLWQASDEVVLVTTPDAVAVMDAYAALKVLMAGQTLASVRLLVNHVHDSGVAADVQERLSRCCQRFLGHSLAAGGHLPPLARSAGGVFVRDEPAGEAATAIERLAAHLAERSIALTDSRPHFQAA